MNDKPHPSAPEVCGRGVRELLAEFRNSPEGGSDNRCEPASGFAAALDNVAIDQAKLFEEAAVAELAEVSR